MPKISDHRHASNLSHGPPAVRGRSLTGKRRPRAAPGSLPFREERVEISWQRGSPGLPRLLACPATGGGLESPQEISGNAIEHEEALVQVDHAIRPLEDRGVWRPAHHHADPL